MGVSTKRRRKIIVNEKSYVWYIKPDDDNPYNILNIISEDKKFIILCPLKTNTSYIISKGLVFQNKQTRGCWERYLLPFCIPEMITPQFITKVILWSTQGEQAVKVAWNIYNIPV
ncbi:MAG: hypothetical protein HDR19_04885 [Lachnospiraceae bacterium]|nr:hypothetical protein [Lachnospiraceae bacterium]